MHSFLPQSNCLEIWNEISCILAAKGAVKLQDVKVRGWKKSEVLDFLAMFYYALI